MHALLQKHHDKSGTELHKALASDISSMKDLPEGEDQLLWLVCMGLVVVVGGDGKNEQEM